MTARLRLVGGELGGRRVTVPPGARPTEGRVREALMSIWAPRLHGARLLDCFAGSGAVAFEALGRGAASATLVEADRRAASTLATSACELGLEERTNIVRSSLPRWLSEVASAGRRFDLVFADPPYDFDAFPLLIEGMVGVLAADGEAVLEHARDRELVVPSSAVVADRRSYGGSALLFVRGAAPPVAP